uniref:DM domain-containing protein n=1 Tax=Electrophorus electricus TaxID=8005 RepID=A0A4W4HLP6_ELEEL
VLMSCLQMSEGSSKTKPSRRCSRCRNHGVISSLKGHKSLCIWKDCHCQKCQLQVEHRRISAAQTAARNQQSPEKKMGIPVSLSVQPTKGDYIYPSSNDNQSFCNPEYYSNLYNDQQYQKPNGDGSLCNTTVSHLSPCLDTVAHISPLFNMESNTCTGLKAFVYFALTIYIVFFKNYPLALLGSLFPSRSGLLSEPGSFRVLHSILAVHRIALFWTEISYVVSGICWSYSSSLGVKAFSGLITMGDTVAFTLHSILVPDAAITRDCHISLWPYSAVLSTTTMSS